MLDLRPPAPPGSFIAGRNPAAKLVVAAVISLTVLTSVDWLTPGLMLAVCLVLLPLCGVNARLLLRRVRYLLLAAGSVAVVSTLFAADKTGAVWWEFGPILITSSAAETGVSLALRVLAVAIPGVLIFTTTDPTELADSLVQQWRMPARFAIGALAALRLLPMLTVEWRMLAMARRARGLDSGGNPIAAVKLFASTMFGLLVSAIRRATRLATAMDARGFDSQVPRTVARPQRVRPADWLMVLIVLVVCGAVLAVSIGSGVHRPLWG